MLLGRGTELKLRIIAVAVVLLVVGVLPGYVTATNWLGHTAGDNFSVSFTQWDLTDDIHDAFHWSDV